MSVLISLLSLAVTLAPGVAFVGVAPAVAESSAPVNVSRPGGRPNPAEIACQATGRSGQRSRLQRAVCEERRTAQLRAWCEARIGEPATAGPLPDALRPNVVLILTDDQRWDSLDVMPTVTDRLADEGLALSNAFVTTPLCGPSRASVLTGQYAHTHGVIANTVDLFDDEETLATSLQSAGYRTAMIGKYMNRYESTPERVPPGWDRWHAQIDLAYFDYTMNRDGEILAYGHAPEDYSTDVFTRSTVEFIEESRDTPFFVMLSTWAPHDAAVSAPRHAGALATLPPLRLPSHLEDDISDKPGYVAFNRQLIAGNPNLPLDERVQTIDATYRGALETLLAVDEGIAEILETLAAHGLDRDTLVIFTSDNGFLFGEHWLTWKYNPYEESIRVPMIFRYPRMIEAGRTSADFGLNIDLAPTIAELAGATLPAAPDGESLVPLLCGGDGPARQEFLVETFFQNVFTRTPGFRSIRTPQYKFIRYDSGFAELYDLKADPSELENLLFTRAQNPVVQFVALALEMRMEMLR